jgi:hypothetical protein
MATCRLLIGIYIDCTRGIVLIADRLPNVMKSSCEVITRLLLTGLVHRQSDVRIASLQAIQLLVPLGAHELIRDLAGYREVFTVNMYYSHGF